MLLSLLLRQDARLAQCAAKKARRPKFFSLYSSRFELQSECDERGVRARHSQTHTKNAQWTALVRHFLVRSANVEFSKRRIQQTSKSLFAEKAIIGRIWFSPPRPNARHNAHKMHKI